MQTIRLRNSFWSIFWAFLILCPSLLVAEGFIAGTLVSTLTGFRAIETLHPEDVVITRTLLGRKTTTKITKVTRIQTKKFVELIVEGQRYFVDNNQKFYLENKYQATEAHSLCSNDTLIGIHGQKARIEEIYFWNKETPIEVYALSLARYHNFCVGTSELITHNMSDYSLIAQQSALAFATSGGLVLSSPVVIAIGSASLFALGIRLLAEYIQAKNKNKSSSESSKNSNKKNGSYQFPKDPKKDDDNDKDKAAELAKRMGFKKTNYRSHGQTVFQKGNKFITRDADSHNGGFWKMADSVENLARKQTRLGTYDKFLNRIGD